MESLTHKSKSVALLIMLVLLFRTVAYAEPLTQPDLSTPTAAPTKTATLEAVSVEATESVPAADLAATSKTYKAFTQADLSILAGNIQRPNGLVWHNGKIYASCSGDWTIYEIDATTGTTAQYIYGVKNAHTLLAAGDGSSLSLWMPDFQSNTVTKIERGVSRNIASNLNGPWGVAAFTDGQYVISNLHANNVVLVGTSDPTEIINGLRSPTGIVVEGDYIYVANTGSARRAIEWFARSEINAADGSVDSADNDVNRSLVSGLQNVTSMVSASDSYLYFSYALGTRGVVGRIDPKVCREKGGCNNNEVEIVLYSELAAPLAGLTISPDMRLYIHSIFSPEIYWVNLNTDPASS